MATDKKPLVLIILDGWGHREGTKHNAIAEANTPFYDSLIKNYPHSLLNASEEHVGLPSGQIGNSEIGHMSIGTGRVIDTDLVKIDKAAASGEFKINPAFGGLFEHVKNNNSTLHILGLVSPGGIHSHQSHLHEFLKAAKEADIKKVAVHAFTDGRDVPPKSAAAYLSELEKTLADLGIGFIATVSGRLYAMDRDKNWDRLQKVEDAIFECKGKVCKVKPSDAVKELYNEGKIDELMEPLVFVDDILGRGMPVEKNDGVFFFNYRPDRARQLSQKILDKKHSHNLFFVTMTEYDKSFEAEVAFPNADTDSSLAQVISAGGLKQSHIAETEKYPHVTYFFNGGHQEPHQNEHHFIIESRKDVLTHDLAPEMKAKEIADMTLERIDANDDFILLNFANADMVGHTANKPAIITAVEVVDRELKRVVEKILAMDGMAIITADHGNAEVNVDVKTGENHTAHTLNQVPFIVVSNHKSSIINLKSSGRLSDIAPTILHLMDINQPSAMTGDSLIEK